MFFFYIFFIIIIYARRVQVRSDSGQVEILGPEKTLTFRGHFLLYYLIFSYLYTILVIVFLSNTLTLVESIYWKKKY